MLYAVKLLVAWVLPPGLFVIALLLLALYLWCGHRRVAILCVSLGATLYMCSIPWGAQHLLAPLEERFVPPLQPVGDVVVMLGGGSSAGHENIGMTGHLSASSTARMVTTMRLALKYNLPIVYTGGKVFSNEGEEGVLVARILSEVGISGERVVLETASRNTIENIRYVQGILKENHYTQPILVTSAFHMPRAVLLCKRYGLEVVPYPTDFMTVSKTTVEVFDFVPNIESLYSSVKALREYLGIVAVGMGYS